MASDCFPNGKVMGGLPGLVKSAVVLLDEDMGDSPVAGKTTFPDFYVDDLVVTVSDAHNLVGNPNFEAAGRIRRRLEHEYRERHGDGDAQREHDPTQRRRKEQPLGAEPIALEHWPQIRVANRRRELRCHVLRHAVGGDVARAAALGGL